MIGDPGPLLGAGLLRDLIARGLAGRRDVLVGDLVLSDLSRRNLNVLVARRGAGSHFVKAATGSEDVAQIANEAAAYERLAAAGTDGLVPALRDHDARRGVLVLEGLRGAEDLKLFHARRAGHPDRVGHLVGDALGRLHAATADAAAPAGSRAPWGLSIHRPTVEALRELTPASLDLIRTIQREPAIGRALDELRRDWRPGALVHNDLKWENVLLVPSPDGEPSIRIIDWEYAGDGEPLWDVGSAVAAYLGSWIRSIDVGRAAHPDDLPRHARIPLAETARAVGALWRAYLARRGPADPGDGLAERVARFAGARLVVAAHESTQAGARLGAHLVLHAQLAANLLARPRQALGSIGLSAAGA